MIIRNNRAVLCFKNFSFLKFSFEILHEIRITNIIDHIVHITYCDISWIKNNIKLTLVLFK